MGLENTKLEACLALALPGQSAGQKSKQRLNVVRCGPQASLLTGERAVGS